MFDAAEHLLVSRTGIMLANLAVQIRKRHYISASPPSARGRT
jgi:hypothetical protein